MIGRDPSDSGGLFTGRRNSQYRPPEKDPRSYDRILALSIIATMIVLTVALWGPLPLAALWLGSQIQYLLDSPFLGIIATLMTVFTFLLLDILILVKLDRLWILVRRAQGIDQRSGVLTTILVVVFAIGLAAFLIWFIFISGFGPRYSF